MFIDTASSVCSNLLQNLEKLNITFDVTKTCFSLKNLEKLLKKC